MPPEGIASHALSAEGVTGEISCKGSRAIRIGYGGDNARHEDGGIAWGGGGGDEIVPVGGFVIPGTSVDKFQSLIWLHTNFWQTLGHHKTALLNRGTPSDQGSVIVNVHITEVAEKM